MTTKTTCSLLDDAITQAVAAMNAVLPATDAPPQRLHEAMQYALMGGGKRVRPALVLGACRAVGGQDSDCHLAMAAVEILHTYTLVHDDLPAMDDDDLRRGRATVHKVWDEPTAILVGDALQALAFECLGKLPFDQAGPATLALAKAVGSVGVVGGQQDDLDAEGGRGQAGDDPAALLDRIHRRKTAALDPRLLPTGGDLWRRSQARRGNPRRLWRTHRPRLSNHRRSSRHHRRCRDPRQNTG